MSSKAVGEFQSAINKNEEIRNKVKKLRSKYPKEKISPSETYNFITKDVIPFAKDIGFDFSFDDYINYQLKEDSNSLEEEELFMINGGRGLQDFNIASAASLLLLADE